MFRRRGTLLLVLSLSGLLASGWLCSRNASRTVSGTPGTPNAAHSSAAPAFTSSNEPKLDGPTTSPEPRRAFQFPGARVLQEHTLGPDDTGLITHVKLLQTRGQYPLVRVIETHREGMADSTERAAMVADHVTVKLSAGHQPAELIAWASTHGLKVRRSVGADDLYLLALPSPDVQAFDALLQRLNDDPARPIDYAEPDYLRFAASLPNDARFAEQWALHNTGQTGGTPDADVDAPEAWDISRGSASVIVAVIDSGMDLTHPDLVSNLWSNPDEAKDGIDNDGNGYIDDVNGWNFIGYPNGPPNDTEGHGTHCAGVLGAVGDNLLGVSGICPSVKLMPLKAIADDGSIAVSSEVSALNYAVAKGAKICSLSFGGPGPVSASEKAAVLAAYNAGVLLVCAAGNEWTNIDAHPSYPASFSYNNVISVAASGHADARIAFSNYGPVSVDLAAPGVGILSTLPGGTYGYESGTSMSTPLVAGACALLSASQPSLNYAAIKSAILSACDPVAAWQGKTRTGGRLNVARALKIGNGPFIELTSVKSSDSRSYGANGNSDGVINAGEDITLTLTVRNGGPVTATGVSTTAAITTGSSAVSIVKGSKTWGALASKAVLTNTTTPLVLRISTGIATETPFTVKFTHTDTAGHTWIEEKTFTIAGTTIIAGRVSTLTGDKAIASATVNYYGPVTGKVSTGRDGRYFIKLPDGIYTITAVATGYQTSPAQTITVPPQPADVNFRLGRGQLIVAPTSIAVTQPEESTTTKTLTLTNRGDLPLTITVENSSLGNAINTAYYNKLSYGDAMRQAAATYAPLPFQEGFEGALSLSPARYRDALYEGDFVYLLDFYGATHLLTSTTAAVGSRSLYYREQYGVGPENGLQRRFPAGTRPRYVSFWVRPGSNTASSACFGLELGKDVSLGPYFPGYVRWEGASVMDVKATAGGRLETNLEEGGDGTVPYTPNQWMLVELRDIDWNGENYDYWVNGRLIKTDIPFRSRSSSTATSVLRLHIYNEGGEGEAWWDEIRVLDHDDAWLGVSPPALTLAPGASVPVTVTLSAIGQRPGSYRGRVDLKSNDPARPMVAVPVTMNVTAHSNAVPVALSQSLALHASEAITFSLPVSDKDNHPLTCKLLSLPKRGMLTLEGSTTPLSKVPVTLPDQATRLVYTAPANASGAGYASFAYTASDFRATSVVATIKFNIVTTNRAPVTVADVFRAIAGETTSGWAPLANDSDADGDALTLVHWTQPTHGVLQAKPGQQLAYTPAADFTFGGDAFDYTVSDGHGGTTTGHAAIVVAPGESSQWRVEGGDFSQTRFVPDMLGSHPLVQQWSAPLDNYFYSIAPPVVADGKVFAVVTHDIANPKVTAVDARTGVVKWQTPVYQKARLVWIKGRVMSLGSLFNGFDSITGAQLWNASGDTGVAGAASAPVPEDQIVIDAGLGACSFDWDGHAFFVATSSQTRGSSPVMCGDHVCVFSGSTLQKLDRLTGNVSQTIDLSSVLRSVDAAASSGRFVVTCSGSLACIDTESGTIMWQATGSFLPKIAIGLDRVYAARQNVVEVRDLGSGALLRTFTVTGSVSDLVLTADTLVTTAGSTTVIFDLATGDVRQTLPVSGYLACAGQHLFIAGSSRFLFCYASSDPARQPAPPVAQSVATDEDTSITITMAAGINTEALITRLPSSGSLYQTTDGQTKGQAILAVPASVLHTGGKVIYEPAPDVWGDGIGSFGIATANGWSRSPDATVSVSVRPVNDAPVARDDMRVIQVGQIVSPVMEGVNDSDADDETPMLVSFTQPAAGTVVANEDGTLRFEPSPLFTSGSTSFQYTIGDAAGATSTATVTIQLSDTPPGDWPTFGGGPHRDGHSPVVLGAGTFTPAWTTQATCHAMADGMAFCTGYYTGEVMALDLASGALRWKTQVPAAYTLSYWRGKLYVIGATYDAGTTRCLDARTGELQWQMNLAPRDSLAPLVTDNGVCFGSGLGLSGRTLSGRSLFSVALPEFNVGEIVHYAGTWAPADWNGLLHTFIEGRLCKHSPMTGRVQKSLVVGLAYNELLSGMDRTPAMSDDVACMVARRLTYESPVQADLVAVRLSSFQELWRKTGPYTGTPAIAGGVVYCLGDRQKMEGHELKTGRVSATYTPPQGTGLSISQHQPLVTHDRLFIPGFNGTVGDVVLVYERLTGRLIETIRGRGDLLLAEGTLAIAEARFGTSFLRHSSINEVTFTPASGNFESPQEITLTSTHSSSSLRYTTDGTAPTWTSPAIASGASVVIDHSCVLRVIAIEGSRVSRIFDAPYTISHGGNVPMALAAPPPAQSSTDSDHDGQSDAAEALAGTNANDAADVFRTCGCETLADGQHVRISWASKVGHNYVVECSSDLKTWSAVSATLPSTAAAMHFDAPVSGTRCFLRVRLVP